MKQLITYLVYALLLVGAAWLVFRVIVRRDYLRKGRLTPLSSALELLVCVLYAGFSALYLPRSWPQVHVGAVGALLGWTLLGLGFGIGLGAMFVFGVGRAFGLVTDELKQSGPYRFSRNPQLVCFGAAMAGAAILWPSWYALGWLLLFGPVFHPMVLSEEEYLQVQFGDVYRDYCRQAPRYLPIPGLR